MNGYVCFYYGKRMEVHALTLLEAKREAVKQATGSGQERTYGQCYLG